MEGGGQGEEEQPHPEEQVELLVNHIVGKHTDGVHPGFSASSAKLGKWSI